MKKTVLLLVLFLIILLNGCDVNKNLSVECVSDELMQMPSSYLVMELPKNVFLTDSAEDGRWSLFSHDDYEIIQEIFPAENMDEAIQKVSGQTLTPILLYDGSARFSWVSGQEDGMICCSAAILSDGTYFYSLCIRCPADLEKEYHGEFSQILSSAALQRV